MPDVPPELTDRVIDYLCLDPSSLRACSAVCRRFLSRTRFHYFADIDLPNKPDVLKFYRLLRESPHIGIYVRRFVLGRILPNATPDREITSHVLYYIISCLPNIQIFINYTLITPDSSVLIRHPGARFQHLSAFCATFRLPSLQSFSTFIDFFPSLSTLIVDGLCWDSLDGVPEHPDPMLLAPQLKYLRCQNIQDDTTFINWLIARNLVQRLISLEYALSSADPHSYKGLKNLLVATGPNLQLLELTLWRSPQWPFLVSCKQIFPSFLKFQQMFL